MSHPSPSKSAHENESGVTLGLALIGALIALLVPAMKTMPAAGEPQSTSNSIALGCYLIAWGLMFLASYYFSHKSFLFRILIWFCEHFSRPASRKMAFFYFALATILGSASIISGVLGR